MSQRDMVQSQGSLKAGDVVLVAALLAAGAVLRLFAPQILGITPNFVIGMYCLAVCLLRPGLKETLGIGLVAAAVCQVTTKSLIPYLNFISEPVGILVAYAVMRAPFDLGLKGYTFKPALVTLLGTLASGLTYISIFKMAILFVEVKKNPTFSYLLLVVLVTAAVNTVLAQALYQPILVALGKKDRLEHPAA
ncbi:MAG: tryptophan transporter [Bacillota bacterium]|uniref:tryptophan transporter n=1 Tax=Desulfurispora thermophila TaxID=265470 RepID=UPI00035D1794|nr:tryptophan transporter [Desulfurispora thermophila]